MDPPDEVYCLATDPPERIRRVFANHGYCIFREFLSLQEVGQAKDSVERLVSTLADNPGVPREDLAYDDVSRPLTLKQIQHLHEHNAFCGALMQTTLRPLAACALGECVVSRNMQYFNKPPLRVYTPGDCSRETPPHQDGYYFMIEPQSAVTMWLALDDADEHNGCLRYVAGSVRKGIRPHDFSDIVGFSQRITDYDNATDNDTAHEVLVRARPGDLVIHHSLTIHRAEPNRTEARPRRAVGAIFYGVSAQVDPTRVAQRQSQIRQRAAQLKGQQQ